MHLPHLGAHPTPIRPLASGQIGHARGDGLGPCRQGCEAPGQDDQQTWDDTPRPALTPGTHVHGETSSSRWIPTRATASDCVWQDTHIYFAISYNRQDTTIVRRRLELPQGVKAVTPAGSRNGAERGGSGPESVPHLSGAPGRRV